MFFVFLQLALDFDGMSKIIKSVLLKNNRKTFTHHTVDLDEKPLLYDYYANTLNPIIDRRSFDEIDNRVGKRSLDIEPEHYGKRFFLERSRTLPALQEQQQRQQQVTHLHFSLCSK